DLSQASRRCSLAPAATGDPHRPRRRSAIPIVTGGRGMDRPTMSAAAAPFLPDDAVEEILSWLPARSLCQFKCVSKAWRDLITNRLRCNKLPPEGLAGFFLNDGNEMPGGDDGGGVGEDRVVGRLVN
ncbi:unnamed protein product, partial [Urochloa humidicola]